MLFFLIIYTAGPYTTWSTSSSSIRVYHYLLVEHHPWHSDLFGIKIILCIPTMNLTMDHIYIEDTSWLGGYSIYIFHLLHPTLDQHHLLPDSSISISLITSSIKPWYVTFYHHHDARLLPSPLRLNSSSSTHDWESSSFSSSSLPPLHNILMLSLLLLTLGGNMTCIVLPILPCAIFRLFHLADDASLPVVVK